MFGGTNRMSQKTCKKTKTLVFSFALFFSLILLQLVLVSAADPSTYDQILQPIQAVYDLVKYSVTVIAGLIMLFAGISYITSGSDPGKREKAKNMVMYVLIGLAVIWAAPFLVKLVLGS